MSSDITKIMQVYNRSQEKAGKLIENATSQAITKTQSTTTSSTSIDTQNFSTNYVNTPYETGWTSAWPTSNHNRLQQPTTNTQHSYRPYEDHIPT